jgi:hypothetical protein
MFGNIPEEVLNAIVPDVDSETTLRQHLEFFNAEIDVALWQTEYSDYLSRLVLKEFIAWSKDYIYLQSMNVFGETILKIPKNPPQISE